MAKHPYLRRHLIKTANRVPAEMSRRLRESEPDGDSQRAEATGLDQEGRVNYQPHATPAAGYRGAQTVFRAR